MHFLYKHTHTYIEQSPIVECVLSIHSEMRVNVLVSRKIIQAKDACEFQLKTTMFFSKCDCHAELWEISLVFIHAASSYYFSLSYSIGGGAVAVTVEASSLIQRNTQKVRYFPY